MLNAYRGFMQIYSANTSCFALSCRLAASFFLICAQGIFFRLSLSWFGFAQFSHQNGQSSGKKELITIIFIRII